MISRQGETSKLSDSAILHQDWYASDLVDDIDNFLNGFGSQEKLFKIAKVTVRVICFQSSSNIVNVRAIESWLTLGIRMRPYLKQNGWLCLLIAKRRESL